MTRSKSNCFTCIFHSEPAVHFRSCSFLWFSAFRTPQNSQNLTNTIRQIEPRTWCWLMYGYVKYILCAAGAPSASRAYGDSHTWKNECGVVVCVSRICLLGAKAPPPIQLSLCGGSQNCRAAAVHLAGDTARALAESRPTSSVRKTCLFPVRA